MRMQYTKIDRYEKWKEQEGGGGRGGGGRKGGGGGDRRVLSDTGEKRAQ